MARKKQNSSLLKQKIWSSIQIILIGALFYLGVALIFFGSGFGSSYLFQQNAEKATSELTAKQATKNKKCKTNYDASKTESISASRILKSKQVKAYAIGRISIPAVNIHNPLFAGYGDQNQNLEYGVVTCLPDRTMGGKNNYVLAGHYMGSYGPAVLDNLHLAKIGDLIYVTDLHHIYAYETKSISFAVKPTQVEVENNVNDKSMITLITCSDFNTSKYGYGEHRTVVQGDLISKVKATKTNLAAAELTANSESKENKKEISLPVKNKKKVVKKRVQVHSRIHPQFFQKMSVINACVLGFNIIFFIIICWCLVRTWRR